MGLSLFIARRIYAADGDRRQVSRPAIRIATVGVAIGLAVMIVTVSVVLGFKHTIRDKVVGFGSHLQVMSFIGQQTGGNLPVCINDTLMRELQELSNVRHVSPYTMTQGILKTDNDFLGVAFKGIDSRYDTTFIATTVKEGRLPDLNTAAGSQQLLVSHKMAQQLKLGVGDRVFAYFIAYDDVRARRFTVCGIYESHMKQFDDALCFTAYRLPQRLNDWETDQCSGLEIAIGDFSLLDVTAAQVAQLVNGVTDKYGMTLTSQSILEAYPQVFSWLSLLDINVWIILVLMVCVAGFTMISGLLIIILERTQMIGLLKALGARNTSIRHTFLWLSVFIIGRGMLAGNVLGVGLVMLQQYTGLVTLDPASYYVDVAPVELSLPLLIALNAATLVACVAVLIAPSFLVSRISPARTMSFE